jgi:hypothetical protein
MKYELSTGSRVIMADAEIGVQVAPGYLIRAPLEILRYAELPRTEQRSLAGVRWQLRSYWLFR